MPTFTMCRTCQASQRCSNWQVVLFIPIMTIHFTKPALSVDAQIRLLKQRGLEIEDEAYARHYRERVGYFRLSAYFYPLLKEPKKNHKFKDGSTFNQAIQIYKFDRKLRLLVFSQIEKIEVAVKAQITEKGLKETGDVVWLHNGDNFRSSTQFQNTEKIILDEWEGSKEDFVIHYKNTYCDNPPAWMMIELIPIGVLSHLYRNIQKPSLQKAISKEFGIFPDVFSSWLFSLSGIRNICCHHNRLWNKILPNTPKEFLKPKAHWIDMSDVDRRKTYYKLAMIKYMLFFINPQNHFFEGLVELNSEFPTVDFKAMDFPNDWQKLPLWCK